MKTALLCTFSILSVAGPALGAPRPAAAPPSVSIRYADLDLSQARDAAVMYKRIQRAASDVCREVSGAKGNDPEAILRSNACYRETVARAVSGLNAPKVSELFAGRSGSERLARLP